MVNSQRIPVVGAGLVAPSERPANAEEYLWSVIERDITELLFTRYTFKMWGLRLRQMDPSVVQRVPIRRYLEGRCFPNDSFQALPKWGYAAMFQNTFDHENIAVRSGTPFPRPMLYDCAFAFLCVPIDEFFDHCFGRLPYRSIRFRHAPVEVATVGVPTATVNCTDTGPISRTTHWHRLGGCKRRTTAVACQPPLTYERGRQRAESDVARPC
jgi:UDP-galactopyranose mutase